jgi:tetratricopeptide (TPR) repeat protein
MSKEIESEDKSYYYALVDEYLSSGQTGRALLQAAKNIAYHEDDPVAYINRARVYEKLGALKNAILDLEEALRITPDNKEVLAYLEKISKRIDV